MKRVRIRLQGVVQGVYFKAEIHKKAEELNVYGTAQNKHDGSVLVILEGEEEAILELINWLKTVDFRGKIEKIETTWEEYKKEFDNFKILPMGD